MRDDKLLNLRIFVSLPGDVPEQRARSLALLRGLPNSLGLADRLHIDPVLWDDPDAWVPMLAGCGSQTLVDRHKGQTSTCHLVIAILAGRFGSKSTMEDGSVIDAGTAHGIDHAPAAKVPFWVYRHMQPQTLTPGDSDSDLQHKLDQFRKVEYYYNTRFTGPDGVPTGAFNPYTSADDFAHKLESHLRKFLIVELQLHGTPYSVPEPDTATKDNAPIVGRADELLRFRSLVQRGHAGVLRSPGVGKTALAMALVHDKNRVLQSFAGVLWMDFGQRPELQPQFKKWARALDVAQALYATLDTVVAWKAEIQDGIGTRRMLIVLDDVWYPDQANDLIRRLPMSVFVVTTRRNQEVACELDHLAANQTIELLDLPEVPSLEFLKRLAPNAVTLLPDRARQLVKQVGGLPQALKLIGKYLHKKSIAGSTDILNRAFDELYRPDVLMQLKSLPDPANLGETQTLGSLVNLSYLALESDVQRRSFVSLSVFRPEPCYFTAEEAVTSSGLQYPVNDFEAFSDLGLIDCRSNEYTLHPIVHGFAQRRLGLQWPETKDSSQNRLLDWYGSKINVMQQNGVTDQYALWYRYEYGEWQADVGNWLYYLAASGDTPGSTVAFLRVYFDAWWWWGFFQPFRICEKLTQEWLHAGELTQALDDWRRAAACALVFQALPEPADEYIVEFFEHLTNRFCRAVLTLAEYNTAGANALALDMHALWQPWWRLYPCVVDTRVQVPIAARDPGALPARSFRRCCSLGRVKTSLYSQAGWLM